MNDDKIENIKATCIAADFAYEVYRKAGNGKAYGRRGLFLPTYNELPEVLKLRWAEVTKQTVFEISRQLRELGVL